MSKLLIEEKNIVVPGQELAEGMDYLPSSNVIREGDKLVATKLGIIELSGRFVKIIPLSSAYVAKEGDLVIGKVTSIMMSGWRVDIGDSFEGVIPLKDGTTDYIQRDADLTKYFNYGDYLITQISKVYNGRLIDLTMKGPGLRKLSAGRILRINSSKVPRIIGKKGSMISLIKESTGAKISVGQNGYIWLTADDPAKELIAIKAIKLIGEESHKSGLTDRIKDFLGSAK